MKNSITSFKVVQTLNSGTTGQALMQSYKNKIGKTIPFKFGDKTVEAKVLKVEDNGEVMLDVFDKDFSDMVKKVIR